MRNERFINRELSWLEFNQRVLEQAKDSRVPLLERVRFLGITATNLDEFFMVRVGGLQELAAEGVTRPDPSGMSPSEQLGAIGERTRGMVEDQYACYGGDVEKRLAEAGIRRMRPADLTEEQAAHARRVFDEEVFPVLTPMAVTRPRAMPLLMNRALHLAVRLEPDVSGREGKGPRYAIVPVSRGVSRVVSLPAEQEGEYAFLLVEDLIAMCIGRLFPGEGVRECAPFRITRNADMGVREDMAMDLVSQMREVLDERKRSSCVRLEISDDASKMLSGFLARSLAVRADAVYRVRGPVHLADLSELVDLPGRRDLRYEEWEPQPSASCMDASASMFDVLSQRGDVLLCHPFESFEPVLRLIENAADDPQVLAIKQILYRTSRNSPIVEALRRAAANGKYVTALVELKARFDEARNIGWARTLEDAGVQVIYGVKGLKTHAKLCLIIRKEPRGIVRYVHAGTGNYNEQTARAYTDVSLMTLNEDIGADASAFFNAVTGYSQPQEFRKFSMAPLRLRERVIEMIEGEAERSRQGQQGRVLAKLNSLADPAIIQALYEASRAGVDISLNVRGICCLRPGVPGLSDHIRVVSIVDRYLEHSRILCFHHGGEPKVFLSSADWMPRNLDRRVELLVPVEDDACMRRLMHILETCLADTDNGWRLGPEGQYVRERSGVRKAQRRRSQKALYDGALEAVRQERQERRTVFQPHRGQTA